MLFVLVHGVHIFVVCLTSPSFVSMQETKVNLEKMTVKLKEAKEETEMIRRDCQAIVKTYQVQLHFGHTCLFVKFNLCYLLSNH